MSVSLIRRVLLGAVFAGVFGVSLAQVPAGIAVTGATPASVAGNDWTGGPSRWDQGVHPRIWFTPALRDKVRGYAKKPGSLYGQMKADADAMVADIQADYVPGQCVDQNGDGFQDMAPDGWSPLVPWDAGTVALDSGKYMTEMYAQFLAFMAMVSPQDTPAEIALVNQYKQQAHDLVMAVVGNAKQGPYDEQTECVAPQQAAHPGMSADDATRTCFCREKRRYRTPKAYWSAESIPFLSGDRGFITGDALPTAIDWVYDSFSAAELDDIRKVFGGWADELIRMPYYVPQPEYVTNSDATLNLDDPKLSGLRFAVNNHTLSYGRAIGMMPLAVDKNASPTAPLTLGQDGVSRRLEDFAPIAMDSFLRNAHIERTKDGRGGMSPEGSMYSALGLRFELSLRLAMMTAGVNDPQAGLGRGSLYGHPFWDAVMPSYLQTLFNAPRLDINNDNGYQGRVYDRVAFGDVQSTSWQVMTDTDFFAMLGVYDQLAGQNQRPEEAKWVLLHAMPGGVQKLPQRLDSALAQLLMRGNLLTYMLLDPDLAYPDVIAGDPRPALAPLTYLPDLGTYIGRTGWDADGRILMYRNSWGRIDHNHQDGNSFDFVRKGRALTRKWLAYGQFAGLSEYTNTLAIKNYCGGPGGAAGSYDGNGVFQPATGTLQAVTNSGSQQYLGAGSQAAATAYAATYQADPGSDFWMEDNPMDPRVLGASASPDQDFTYISGDASILYNRWDQWNAASSCQDVTHASRAMVWLKPDHMVIYDRAATAHNGFKRFWLSLPPSGYTSKALQDDLSHIQIAPGATDVLTTVSLPAIQVQGVGGLVDNYEAQRLHVRTLLPPPGGVTVSKDNLHPEDGYDLSAGAGQIMRARLKVEANGDPQNVRFLHVVQGADGGVAADPASVLSAVGMEGAVVNGWAVLFVKDVGQVPTAFSYTAPPGVVKHVMTGLAPNSQYNVVAQPAGGGSVTIDVSKVIGGALTTDAAGVLVYPPQADVVPDPFVFVDQVGVAWSTQIESNPIVVSGIASPATLTVNGGEYAISTDGGATWGAWSNAATTVSASHRVKVRHLSAPGSLVTTNTTLALGGVSDTFSSTTLEMQTPPVMGNVPNQAGIVGTAFNLALVSYVTLTDGDPVTAYAIATGALPPGLALNAANGIVSGTPNAAGVYNITVTATDNDGASNADAIQFAIAAAPPQTPPSMGNVPNRSGTVGMAFNLVLAGYVAPTDGDPVTAYAIASGALPPGLALDGASGVVSGTPNTAGVYTVTVTATDNDGASNADAIQFTIAAAQPLAAVTPIPTLSGWAVPMLTGLTAALGLLGALGWRRR